MFSLIVGLVFFREFDQGRGEDWSELAVNCLHETAFFVHLLMHIGHGRLLLKYILDNFLDTRGMERVMTVMG